MLYLDRLVPLVGRQIKRELPRIRNMEHGEVVRRIYKERTKLGGFGKGRVIHQFDKIEAKSVQNFLEQPSVRVMEDEGMYVLQGK